jgi:hypothetical protein
LQSLQTRIESEGGQSPSLNGVLVLSLIALGGSSEEVKTHVVTNQLANTQGLPKSEALVVVNIGGDGAAPCVTIEPLIHTVHSILRGRSRDLTWWQFKNNVSIIRRV